MIASEPIEEGGREKGAQISLHSQQSDNHFRFLVDTMPQLAWMADADGYIFWYNRRWYEFTKTTPEQMRGWGWQSVHDPQESPKVMERWTASIRTGEPFEMEFPLRGGDGVFQWFLTRVTPVRDEQGDLRRWFGTHTDVTEIREAREILRNRQAEFGRQQDRLRLENDVEKSAAQLRESDERYRIFIENIQDYAILMLDPRGNVASWNGSAERMTGYPAAQIIGKHFSCFYPAGEIENGLPELVLRRAALEGHFEFEGLHLRKDGSCFWASVMVTALRDHSGALLGFTKMARDNTARKQADDDLRRQTAELKQQAALLDLSHDAIDMRTAEGGVISFWNHGATELYGWTAREAVGRNSYELLKTVFPQPLQTIEDEIHQSGNWEGELTHTRSDGSLIIVASRWALHRDDTGQPCAILAIARDITLQKAARWELRDALDRLNLALRGGGIGTWTWDIAPDAFTCDDYLPVLFGLAPGRISAHIDYFVSLIHPEDQAHVRTQFAQALKTGNYEAEFRVPLEDETVHFITSRAETTFEGSEAVKVTGVCWDVTERKRFEAELKSKAEELERFTYTVSHDLKSPLITIKSYAGLIDQELATENLERARLDLHRIEKAADKMTRLLEELLALSRIGRVVSTLERIPFEAVVEDALELVAGRIRDRHVHVDVAAHLPTVTVDRPRMVEVMQNLIDNAAKFMGDQTEPRIEIGVSAEGTETRFFVRDNGVGVDVRHHQRIFGLFDKIDPKSEGSGAGLALVKRIIEMHGGRIWLDAPGLGAGSTFWFTLKDSYVR